MTKTTTDKTFQTKDPLTPFQNPPDKNPHEQLRENLYRGLSSGIFVLGLLKIGVSEMCEVLLWVPGCVTRCDRGGESKLAKNSVTYFMDGPGRFYKTRDGKIVHDLLRVSLSFRLEVPALYVGTFEHSDMPPWGVFSLMFNVQSVVMR